MIVLFLLIACFGTFVSQQNKKRVFQENLTNFIATAPIATISRIEKFEQEEMKRLGLDLPFTYFSWNDNNPDVIESYIPSFSLTKENAMHYWFTGLWQGVNSKLMYKLLRSIMLITFGLLLATVFAVWRGGFLYVKRKQLGFGAHLGYVIPSYVFGVILLYLVANPNVIDWFYFPMGSESSIESLILPGVTMAFGWYFVILKMLNGAISDESDKPYVTVAKAKGMSRSEVYYRHILKNTMPALLGYFSIILPSALGTSVLIEGLFNIDGLGRYLFFQLENNYVQELSYTIAVVMMLGVLSYLIMEFIKNTLYPKLLEA